MKYTPTNRPQKNDRVEWNWAGGTKAVVRNFDGRRAEIRTLLGKGRIGRAIVYPGSLILIERPAEQPQPQEAVA